MSESASPPVETLLHHPEIWRARRRAAWLTGRPERDITPLSTGHAALDRLLADGGWPRDGLVELLGDQCGIGELRLLIPALAALSNQEPRWLLWVNPPHIPYAPALESLGVDVRKVLLVHPRQHQDALWALEQAQRSGTCGAALAWFDESRLRNSEIRRLKLAARAGRTLTLLFRPDSAAHHASMAELRLRLRSTAPQALHVEIVKRRGGWPANVDVTLPAPTRVTRVELEGHLALWRRHHTGRRGETRPWPIADGKTLLRSIPIHPSAAPGSI